MKLESSAERGTAMWKARFRLAPLSVALITLSVIAGNPVIFTGCSTGEGEDVFEKIDPGVRIYTIDDFRTIGIKTSKQYDVDGLPASLEAWFGFWQPRGPGPKEYELRFYASHEDAVRYGQALAEEVTGEDAVLTVDEATWKVGMRDRRAQGGELHTFGTIYPRYGDFVIFGNVVMLCEGLDSGQSLERCSDMIEAIRALDE